MSDPKSTDVFFKSCKTLVSFQNPSDAAIAHLSAAGFTESAMKTVLNFIVSNPVFDPKEVTLKSAWSIDETISEHRRKQVEQRSAYDHSRAPHIGGPPIPVVRLVTSHAYERMPLFEADVQSWYPTREADEIIDLLREMSLVHRSWTNIAQEFLFRRIKISGGMHRDKLRGLLQHPYLSRVREFICEVPCDEGKDSDGDQDADADQDSDKETIDQSLPESIGCTIHLLRRLGPLRYLSLLVPSNSHISDKSFKMHCSTIYSQLSRHLPNLNGLWLTHHDVDGLRDCVESVLRGRIDGSPITLNKLGISITRRERVSRVSFSPAILRSLDQGKDHGSSEVIHDVQEPALNPEISGTRDVFIDFAERHPLGAFFGCLFDRDMGSAVLGDIFSGIRRLAIRYPYTGKLEKISDYDEFRAPADQKIETDTNANWFFSRWLKKCTALTHIDLAFSEDCDFSMKTLPITDFPASTEVVSIYLPENWREIADGLMDSNFLFPGRAMAASIVRGSPLPGTGMAWNGVIDTKRQERSCGLDHLMKQLYRRPGKLPLKRLEVIFCRELDYIVTEYGLVTTIQDAKDKANEIDVPLFLLYISATCRMKGVDFVVKEAILFSKY